MEEERRAGRRQEHLRINNSPGQFCLVFEENLINVLMLAVTQFQTFVICSCFIKHVHSYITA